MQFNSIVSIESIGIPWLRTKCAVVSGWRHAVLEVSQNCEVLCNCLRITWLVVKFEKLNELRMDWRIVQGFLGTAQSFINPRDCRRLDQHCNGCSRMRSNRRGIIRAAWNRVLIFGSGFNWRAICLNCNRIANNRNCDVIGWIAKGEIIDCIRIATTRESVYCGLWGTERIAKDPQATVWTCPRVRAQTWRSAVRLGLIANHSWNPQLCMDCPSIGQIEPRLHCSYSWCSSVTFHSIALGLPPFVQSRCNRDW